MTQYLTKEGLKELEAELKEIQEVEIPRILHEINQALSQGDISENAALDAAREEHQQILSREAQVQDTLNDYELIDESSTKGSTTVVLGSTVVVVYASNNQEFTLKIVGGSEANAIENKISNESPLARAILGKKKGTKATFKTNAGQQEVTIKEIKS